MSFTVQRMMAWSGLVLIVLMTIGFLLAGLLPVPPGANLNPEQVVAFYTAHPTMTRIGLLISSVGFCFLAPMVALITAQMARIKNAPTALGQLQQIGGTCIVIVTVVPLIMMNVAAFRPDRNPATIQALNDLAWLLIITPIGLFYLQEVPIAIAILLDRSAHPVFPRWVGYANLWIALSFLPALLAYFAKTGPVAWQGVLVFYLGFATFGAWVVIMTWALLRAVRQQQHSDSTAEATQTVSRSSGADIAEPLIRGSHTS
jgi:hypothetical protein